MITRSSTVGLDRLILFALCALLASLSSALSAENLDEVVAHCTSCHGEEGRPVKSDIPIIWGQEYYYLYVQLKDYKSGLRDNELMSGIAAGLSKEQMKALAQHFSEKEWPRIGFRAEDSEIAAAQIAVAAGFCPQCHLGEFRGNSRIPRLAGQQPDYLERTMIEFKNKVRQNSASKGTLLGGYTDADIHALAHYLAGF